MKWFVSFYTEVYGSTGIKWWPSCRIITDHPFVWFAKRVASRETVILTWWTQITDEEAALNTQIIDDEG